MRIRISLLCGLLCALSLSMLPAVRAEEPAAAPAPAASGIDDRFDFADGLYARNMYDMAATEYQNLIKEAPDHPRTRDASYRLAESYFFLKQYDKAMAGYQAWLAKFPSEAQADSAKLRIAESLYYQGKTDEALAQFGTMAGSPKPLVKSAAHYYLGKILLETGREAEAKPHFEALREPGPDNGFSEIAVYHLGQIALKDKDYKTAADEFKKLGSSEKADLKELAAFGLGQVSFLSGDYEQARQAFLQTFQLSKKPEVRQEALLNAAKSLFELKQYSGILDLMKPENLQGLPNAAPLKMMAATARFELGQFNEALALYDEILVLPGITAQEKEAAELGKVEAILRSGDAAKALAAAQAMPQERSFFKDRWTYLMAEVMKQAGKSDEALKLLDSLPQDTDPEFRSRAELNRAHILLDSGDLKGARAQMDQFLKDHPDHPLAKQTLMNRISLDIKLGELQEATKSSDAFLQKFGETPEGKQVRYQLASLYLSLKDYPGAFSAYEKYLQLYPDDEKKHEALFYMGYAKQLAGDIQKAVEYYTQVQQGKLREDLYAGALKNLAYCYVRLEKWDAAAAAYRQLLKSGSGSDVGPDIYLWLAEYYRSRQDGPALTEVMESFKSSPKAAENAAEAEYFSGEAARLTNQPDKALAHYDACLQKESPVKAKALLGKATVMLDRNDPAAAVPILEDAIRQSKDDQEMNLEARMKLASVYKIQSNFLEAAKAYLAVAILYDDPASTPDALWNAGENFEKAEHSDEARKAYQELTQRYPSHPLAAQAQSKLGTSPS
ncbi:MAG TPA: tetratricopeptide repeat protein [Verrucomicrobiae bacterium]|nr:tetratricopeptide repeat protein [Verrucomicrobiae bacterium]